MTVLYINDEKVERPLDPDMVLETFAGNLNKESAAQHKVAYNWTADGVPFDLQTPNPVKQKKLSEISEIRLLCANTDDLAVESLADFSDYAIKIIENIPLLCEKLTRANPEEKYIKMLSDVLEGLLWAKKTIISSAAILEIDKSPSQPAMEFMKFVILLSDCVASLPDNIETFSASWEHLKTLKKLPPILEKIIKSLPGIMEIVEKQIMFSRVLGDEVGARVQLLEQSGTYIKELEQFDNMLVDIAVGLTTGDEKNAMDTLALATSILEKIYRFFHDVEKNDQRAYDAVTIDNKSLKEFHVEIKKILQDTIESLQNRDSVLLADILEYDLKPKTKELHNYLAEIENILTPGDE